MNNNIDEILKSLIGHKVTLVLNYTNDTTVRNLMGILKNFNDKIIHLVVFGDFNEPADYYLNRFTAQLLAVVDEGIPKSGKD